MKGAETCRYSRDLTLRISFWRAAIQAASFGLSEVQTGVKDACTACQQSRVRHSEQIHAMQAIFCLGAKAKALESSYKLRPDSWQQLHSHKGTAAS